MGAPIGNQNARKRHWSNAIESAVNNDDPVEKRKRLNLIAERLVQMAQDGDIQAMKEIGDRLDGKAAQVLAGDVENPLTIINKVERVIVNS